MSESKPRSWLGFLILGGAIVLCVVMGTLAFRGKAKAEELVSPLTGGRIIKREGKPVWLTFPVVMLCQTAEQVEAVVELQRNRKDLVQVWHSLNERFGPDVCLLGPATVEILKEEKKLSLQSGFVHILQVNVVGMGYPSRGLLPPIRYTYFFHRLDGA